MSTPLPAFQTSESLWPLDAPPQQSSSDSKKPRNRHLPRRKPENAAHSSSSATASAPANIPFSGPHVTDTSSYQQSAPGGPSRGSWRGRGRGGFGPAGGRGGAARALSSSAPAIKWRPASAVANNAEDTGVPVPRAPFARARGGGPAPIDIDWRRHASSGPGGKQGGKKGKKRKVTTAEKNTILLNEVERATGPDADLAKQIMKLYELQRPSEDAVVAREHLIQELEHWLNGERFKWGHPHNSCSRPIRIEPFGSARFGLGTSTSDLDLCLLDPYRPEGFSQKYFSSRNPNLKDLPDIYNMRRVARSLERANLSDVRAIAGAAVPICKFKVEMDGHQIEVDLNTNERLGVYNSRLINSYCNLHPLVRPLSVFIKFWAKQRGLNNPATTPITFSSYTLILLVIAYLQHLEILPCLQDPNLIEQAGVPQKRFFSTPKTHARNGRRRGEIVPSIGRNVTFVELDAPPEGDEPAPADLLHLARGFFHYYADEFDMEKYIVSVWRGEPLARQRPYKPTDELAQNATAGEEQNEEDFVLDALREADERDPQLQATQVDVDGNAQSAAGQPPRPDSRSSEPMEYGEFEEPERWERNLLVVQDPFILDRNPPGNVHPDWVDEFRFQMRRARGLIDQKAPLKEICASIESEPHYVPLAIRLQAERSAEAKKARREKKAEKRKQAAAAAGAALTPALASAGDPAVLADGGAPADEDSLESENGEVQEADNGSTAQEQPERPDNDEPIVLRNHTALISNGGGAKA
ncbi:PAP/25A associated domain family [Rhodotorula toruloides]|uniref:PAP/25A associated domain family n=1 Tax=Rhodotorula toruloides TaxID=5286 RepID=A0A511KLE7_RHOTO|nr:PAP/25A associated domain family [Rhodotorula toruloides]